MEADIPENLMEIAVPRLCLQPILENAVLHGFAAEKKWGSIAVFAYEDEGYLFIDVIDDGVGMDKDAVQKMNARLESGEQSDHIGIVNTNMRIRLHYGEDCGLRVISNPTGGLCVRIKIRRMGIETPMNGEAIP
jgi:two-component system sensor histidine kinase YesM